MLRFSVLKICENCVLVLLLCLISLVSCDDPRLLHDTVGERSLFRWAILNVSYFDENRETEVFRIEGKYGRKSPHNHIAGVLVYAVSADKNGKTNNYGCVSYINKKFPSDPWIALVQRGECNFTKKIEIAKKHKADAIIIYNNNSDTLLTIMEHSEIASIVSVFIGTSQGKKLVDLVNKSSRVFIQVIPGEHGETLHAGNGINKTSVLFVSISFVVLMLISLAWLIFYYIQRFRYSHAKERLARRLTCAAKKAIAKIPQKTIKAGDKELEADFDQCAVCIESYKAHEDIRVLPCRHVFHKSCVDPWLLDQRSCPMCKLDILRAYGMQIGGSQESVVHDQESVQAAEVADDEPEASSSAEGGATQTDDMKVLLAPHFCLHIQENELAGDDSSSQDAVVGCRYQVIGVSKTSLTDVDQDESGSQTPMCSSSRTQKEDVRSGTEMETQALMSAASQLPDSLDADEKDAPSNRNSLQSRDIQ